MNIRHLIFCVVLLFSLQKLAHGKYIITAQTDYLFLSGLNTCSSYTSSFSDLIEYYTCFRQEVLLSEKINKLNCSKNLKLSLKSLGCPDAFINKLSSAYNQDNLEAHKKKLAEIKSEYESFKSKNLSGSAQLNKYMNYIENNSLEGMVVADPEIVSELAINKDKFLARKKSCSEVINLKSPLSLDKPRNQDTIGWCYAFTASDLLTHALGKQVSAVQLSGLFNDKFIYKLFNPKGEGGFVSTALSEALKNGICLESDLPSEDYAFSKLFDSSLLKIFKETRRLGEYYSKQRITVKEVKNGLCADNQMLLISLQELFPNLSVDQFSEILLKSGVNAFTEMTKTCNAQKDEALNSLKLKTVWSSHKIFPTIDEQLDKGNILGMSYNEKMLGYSLDGGSFPNHASSIVGRRFNEMTMSCEYLVRNSWGKSCSFYSEDYDCKDGHVWIGEEFFKHKNSIFGLQYVEKK